jgi:hypothetical protein
MKLLGKINIGYTIRCEKVKDIDRIADVAEKAGLLSSPFGSLTDGDGLLFSVLCPVLVTLPLTP